MSALEIKKKVVEVNFGDQKIELKMCSTMRAKELFKKMKAVDKENDVDQLIDIQEELLRDCGAPNDLLDALDFEQFKMLSDAVMGLKKN